MIPTDPFKTYKHKNGRQFRVTGINRNEEPTFIKGIAKHKWMVSVRFLDNDQPLKMFYDESDQKYKEVWK